jgi:hypothetical protein
MGQSAKVHSIQAIEDYREALCAFAVDGQDALGAVDMQVRRAVSWLAEKQKYWVKEIRERHDEVQRAKIELQQRKYENRDGRGRGTSEPEKNLRKAEARLKEAEQKAANCKRWQPELQHAVMEYQGPARQLSGALESELKHAVAVLDQKIEALESYLALAAPSAPILEPVGSTGPESVASVVTEAGSMAQPLPEPAATDAPPPLVEPPADEQPPERTAP